MYRYLIWALIRRLKCNRLIIWLVSHLPYRTIDLSGYSLENIVKRFSKYSRQPKTSCLTSFHYSDGKEYDLDIIIPVYLTENTIRKCLDSILNQKTKYAFRVICIDDGSPDNAGKILDEYAKVDSRVCVVHQKNRGLSGARNAGLKMVCAEYIMFVDSDDYLEKDSIEKLLDDAKEKNADIIVSGYHLVDKEGKIISTVQNKPKYYVGSIYTQGYMCMTLWKSCLFTGICFPEGYWFEDGLNWIVLSRLANTCYLSDVVSYNYLQNPEGICNRSLHDEKAVDTILICWELISDVKNLPEIRAWDSNGYMDFLKHVKVSERRLRFQSKLIQREAFIFLCFVYEEYFKNIKLENSNWGLLEKALDSKNELLYHAFCELV